MVQNTFFNTLEPLWKTALNQNQLSGTKATDSFSIVFFWLITLLTYSSSLMHALIEPVCLSLSVQKQYYSSVFIGFSKSSLNICLPILAVKCVQCVMMKWLLENWQIYYTIYIILVSDRSTYCKQRLTKIFSNSFASTLAIEAVSSTDNKRPQSKQTYKWWMYII